MVASPPLHVVAVLRRMGNTPSNPLPYFSHRERGVVNLRIGFLNLRGFKSTHNYRCMSVNY